MGLLGALTLAILVTVSVYDGYYVRVSDPQIVLGYTVLVPAGLLALLAVATVKLPRPLSAIVPVWALALFGYGAFALLRDVNPVTTTLVDVVNYGLPLVLLLAVLTRPGLVSMRAIRFVLVGLAVAAVVAFLINRGLRYDTPSAVLLAGLWVWVSRRPGWLSGGAVALAGILTLDSGYRTHLVLWAVLGFLALAAGPRWLRGALLLVGAGGAVLLLFGVIAPQAGADANSTRIFELADESTIRRLDEIRDVWNALITQPVWQHPFGNGMGGSFPAFYAHESLNLDRGTGLVHHIHVGPVATAFRFGLFGLAVMVALYVKVGRSVLAITKETPVAQQFFRLAAAGLMLEWLFFDVTTYPMFGYAMAGFLCYEYAAKVSDEPTATVPRQRPRAAAARR